MDAGMFPTDLYMASSVARLIGARLVQVPMRDLRQELEEHGSDVAVILAGAVNYRSGELYDIAAVTKRCHEQGALAMWDLCHAAGAVDLQLDDDDVDLAVGCTYKYLSGGPGSPAFVYVAERHQDTLDLPLTGWHGHERPFDFASEYVPAGNIAQARIGTPHILSMLALEEALGVFQDAPIPLIRARSLALGAFFFTCLDRLPTDLELGFLTPRDGLRRGSHVALTHPRSEEVMVGLMQRKVICDRRPTSILRFGFNALYVSFEDIFKAVGSLVTTIMELT